ncbi:MAG: alpha/beta-type small acid-soluble spore protein [Desulfitobacteriia bacterium]
MGRNSALDHLKLEVSKELGYINSSPEDYRRYLQTAKFEVANELGIHLNPDYNGDLTSRDAGRIGGQIGGKIGGNMVRKMVEFAQNHMQNNGGSL